MGAVSSLLYASRNPDKIQCLVLDSPFSDIKKIIDDIIKSYRLIPGVVASFAYKKARSEIFKKVNIDIS